MDRHVAQTRRIRANGNGFDLILFKRETEHSPLLLNKHEWTKEDFVASTAAVTLPCRAWEWDRWRNLPLTNVVFLNYAIGINMPCFLPVNVYDITPWYFTLCAVKLFVQMVNIPPENLSYLRILQKNLWKMELVVSLFCYKQQWNPCIWWNFKKVHGKWILWQKWCMHLDFFCTKINLSLNLIFFESFEISFVCILSLYIYTLYSNIYILYSNSIFMSRPVCAAFTQMETVGVLVTHMLDFTGVVNFLKRHCTSLTLHV